MKRSFVVLLGIVLVSGVSIARAQVAPSARSSHASYWAGGEFSVFQPDIQFFTITSSPRILGIGAYADADITRWIQIEAQGRWLHWNQDDRQNSQNTYMIGPRVPIHEFNRFTPYGKFLIGFANGNFLNGNATAWTYGGGVDYHLRPKIRLRGEFEYQEWRVQTTSGTLHPYGVNIGASYRFW